MFEFQKCLKSGFLSCYINTYNLNFAFDPRKLKNNFADLCSILYSYPCLNVKPRSSFLFCIYYPVSLSVTNELFFVF